MAEVAARSRRDAKGNPHAQVSGRLRRRRAARRSRTSARRCAARPAADHRRRGRGRARAAATRPGSSCERPGVDQRPRPPHRAAPTRACATSPTSPSTTLAGARPPGSATARSRSPSCRPRSRHEELLLREALGLGDRRRRQPVGRRRSPPTRSWRPASSASPRRRSADRRRRHAARARARDVGAVPATEPRLHPGGGLT